MKHGILAVILLLFMMFLVESCSTHSDNFAPVTNGWSSDSASRNYRVQPDDTLYSIAFRFGTDYRKLASLNHLSPPYDIIPGQNLQILSDNRIASQNVVTSGVPETQPIVEIQSPSTINTQNNAKKSVNETKPLTGVVNSSSEKSSVSLEPSIKSSGKWNWPASGKIIQRYSSAYGGNKGIDIAGNMGDPIRASASGKVVYCGSGLKGYGLLIIIKHNAEYLSAYAHNSKALVKEGQTVRTGQEIALMGNTNAPRVMLHFEIREAGKPIDPLLKLPSQ